MSRNIGVIVPFKEKKNVGINKRTIAIALFAKKIIEKYSTLGLYGFDAAAMVFLEKIAEGEKQDKDIKRQIEFTVKLMLLHQNRNRLSRDIINENTAFQKNITNHVMVNLNRLLTVDKRVYRELSQLSYNNVKLKEAYDKIVKLENYEKKLVFQVRNQQTIKPKMLKNSFYQMFQRMLKQNQLKLSSQLFKESVERQQWKQNLNKLLELQTFRSDVERHEFLHVMQHGTLEERREAMEILKQAVMEVNTNIIKKEDKRSWFMELVSHGYEEALNQNVLNQNLWQQTIKILQRKHVLREHKEATEQHNWLEYGRQNQAVQGQKNEKKDKMQNQAEIIYQVKQKNRKEEVRLQVLKKQKEEQELRNIKQILQKQQTIQEKDHKLFEEIQTKLSQQDRLVNQLVQEQMVWKKSSSTNTISSAITKQLKSELHLDRMRYGAE